MPKKKVVVPVLPDVSRLVIEPIRRLAYTPEEAAASSGIGLTRIYKLIKDEQLGATQNGRSFLIPVAELGDYLIRTMTRGTAPAKSD